MSRARALVLGWHTSRPRQLRTYARLWSSRQLEPVSVVPDTFIAMARADGWQRNARALARDLARTHASEPLPWIAHAFSNAGFWSLVALLSELRERHLDVFRAYRGALIDCAPGFPERVSAPFTAKFAGKAMLPGLLASLGLTPSHTHPWLGPPTSAFLGAWHLISPSQVRFIEQSQARLIEIHLELGAPLHLVHAGHDELVLPRYVEEFEVRAAEAGVATRRECFARSAHVRCFLDARERYLERVDAFEAAALPAG